MSSFVHVDQPISHPGVARAEQVIGYVQEQGRELRGTRGLGVVLLAAAVAAVLGLADNFITHWTDGSLMAAWLLMWLVAFLAIALFAGAARQLAARAVAGWTGLQHRAALRRSDAKLMDIARNDPRVMNDLMAAMTRSQADAEVLPLVAVSGAAAATSARMPTVYEAMRRLNSSRYY